MFIYSDSTNEQLDDAHPHSKRKVTVKQSSGHRLMPIWIKKQKTKSEFEWCRKDRVQEGSWSSTETECCDITAPAVCHQLAAVDARSSMTKSWPDLQARSVRVRGHAVAVAGPILREGGRGGGVVQAMVVQRDAAWLQSVGWGVRGYSPLLYSRAGRGTSWEVGIRIEMQ